MARNKTADLCILVTIFGLIGAHPAANTPALRVHRIKLPVRDRFYEAAETERLAFSPADGKALALGILKQQGPAYFGMPIFDRIHALTCQNLSAWTLRDRRAGWTDEGCRLHQPTPRRILSRSSETRHCDPSTDAILQGVYVEGVRVRGICRR